MPDSLLQLASTIFLTFGLGTLLYALVTYFLKMLVEDEPNAQSRRGMAYPAGPAGPQQMARYGPPQRTMYPTHGTPPQAAPPQQHLPGYASPPAYPTQQPWRPPGAAPRG